MNVIYDKTTGKIDRAISNGVDYKIFLSEFPKEFVDNLESLHYEGVIPRRLGDYYVNLESLDLEKYTQEVIDEKKRYGRTLTEEERLNILLQPSRDEVKKAENTIEILSILGEVGLL